MLRDIDIKGKLEFFLLFPFIVPFGISYYLGFIHWYQYSVIAIALLISLFFLLNRNFDKLLLSEILFSCLIIFTDIINGVNINKGLTFIMSIFGVTLWCKLFLNLRRLKTIGYYFDFIIIMTFIFYFKFPNGISQDNYQNILNFLGTKNMVFEPLIITLVLFCCNYLQKRSKINILLLLAICIISGFLCLLVNTSTGMSLIAIYLFLCLIQQREIIRKVLQYHILVIASLVICIVVVGGHTGFLNNILYTLFHKDTTYSSRAILWKQAVNLIKEKWITGYGIDSSVTNAFTLVGQLNGFSAHNMFLEITLYSGVVGLVCFIVIIWQTVNKMECTERITGNTFLKNGVFVFLIYFMFEVRADIGLFTLMLSLSYYWPINNQKQVGVKNGMFNHSIAHSAAQTENKGIIHER